jgi:tetratricopeptide (TPR) repeat protein
MGIQRGLVAMVVVCAIAAPARAASEEDERAKAHFLAGQSYYEQASYTDALREFNEAYRISKRPALLYNIARCHEALENYADAVKMLEAYLDQAPETTDRVAVETRIANLKERQAAREAKAQAPVVKTPPATTNVRPPPPHRKRIYTWIVGGIGVAALASALGTGIASQLSYNDLSSKCSGTTCDPATVANAQSKIDSGKRLALATDILWPIGAAAAVTGIVLFFVEGRHHKEHGGLAIARDY